MNDVRKSDLWINSGELDIHAWVGAEQRCTAIKPDGIVYKFLHTFALIRNIHSNHRAPSRRSQVCRW
jgi:hypothetical protein